MNDEKHRFQDDDDSTLCPDDEQTSLLYQARLSYSSSKVVVRKARPRQRLLIALLLSSCLALLGTVLWLFGSLSTLQQDDNIPVVPENIAIIGAGPAGIAVADSLARFSKKKGIPINVTIYERKHAIGGRLVLDDTNHSALVYPFDDYSQAPLEPEDVAGSSLLFSSKILCRMTKDLGFSVGTHENHIKLGIFDGDSFIVNTIRPSSETSWSSWWSQVYRYGISVSRAVKLPIGTMGKASRLAKLSQRSSFPYESVQDLVAALDLVDGVSMSGEERLRKNGISRKYQEEVLVPETRRRLNQDVTEVSDLALSMAVYDENQGISQTGGHIIPTLEEMLLNSGAQLRLQTEIMGGLKHQLVRTGEWEWILQSHQIGREVEQSSFQKVIIATPWDATTNENIDTLEEIALASEYRPRHITLFTTTQSLDPEIFGQQESLPDWILPTMIKPLDHLDGIHEIAHVRNLTRTTHHTTVIERLYRILSTHEIGDEWLASLFVHRDIAPTWVHRDKIRNAYPLLFPRTVFPPIVVADSLWYTAATETFMASVDMSLFAGANVAALVIAQIEKERV